MTIGINVEYLSSVVSQHVILAAGKLFTAKTGEGAAKILEKIRKQHPGITPEIAYLPKAHSLILWL